MNSKDDQQKPAEQLAVLDDESDTAPVEKLQLKQAELGEKRVLVLEDDPVQVQLLSSHLESLNMLVVVAGTIAAAEAELEKQVPHLGIFDVRLPDGSGLDLCERIDSDSRLSGIPIIVLSSMDTQDMVRRTRASGGRYFLGKPYDPNVLLLVIEQLLRE